MTEFSFWANYLLNAKTHLLSWAYEVISGSVLLDFSPPLSIVFVFPICESNPPPVIPAWSGFVILDTVPSLYTSSWLKLRSPEPNPLAKEEAILYIHSLYSKDLMLRSSIAGPKICACFEVTIAVRVLVQECEILSHT